MTVRENLLPSAMVPGLVTIEDKDGNRQNVYPVDAKELIQQGDYKLVENGAVEVARLAATPLRSGMAGNLPPEQLATEISGIAGSVVIAEDEKARDKLVKAGDHADNVAPKAPPTAGAQDEKKADESAHQPKSGAEKAAAEGKPAASGGDGNKSGAEKK